MSEEINMQNDHSYSFKNNVCSNGCKNIL